MTSAMTVAVTVVRAWTRAYTYGIPSVWAEQRRAEIESDRWELQHDPDGARGLAPAVQVLGRLFAGIGDDLSWRLERTTLQDNVLIRRAVTLAAATARGSSAPGCRAGPRVRVEDDVLEPDTAVRPELRVLRVVPGEVFTAIRNVCLKGTHWRRRQCAHPCAQTRSNDHHPAANANQGSNKKRAEISRIPARSVIPGSLSKPPPSLHCRGFGRATGFEPRGLPVPRCLTG
jgi:hypothetical protein